MVVSKITTNHLIKFHLFSFNNLMTEVTINSEFNLLGLMFGGVIYWRLAIQPVKDNVRHLRYY